MTHEFKTPISTISISSEVLKEPKISTEPDRLLKYASIIQHESNRLKQQVDRVLEMARLDEKKIDLINESIDGHKLIEEAIQNSSILLNEKDGKIETHFNATESLLFGDKLHLTNALNNLIDNAIKYNQNKPKIIIRSYNKKNTFCIEIEDNGIGISPENKRRIFERFFRVHTGNIHDVKGFGLGLSYVKLIVQAHRGTIELQSVMGQGTIFKISLPTS